MKLKQHLIFKKVLLSGLVTSACISTISHAQTDNLVLNPGFENNFNHWEVINPSEVSDQNHKGTKFAKINGQGASATQKVSVEPFTDYVFSAYVKNFGRIGVFLGNSNDNDIQKRIHAADDWTKAEVEFNSGSASSVRVYAEYYRGQGNYDDFSLMKKRAIPLSTDSLLTQCPGIGGIPIKAAYDDGSNDGNPAKNAIDGNLSNRWSTKGTGKRITFELNQVVEAKKIDIQWYKSAERISLFSVQTSLDGNNWQDVLNDSSSTPTTGFDSYDIESFLNSDARFVRIVGNGNSSNEWNSIAEVKIQGCVN